MYFFPKKSRKQAISRILLFFGYLFQPEIESWQFRPKKELANCSFKKKESCYGKFGSVTIWQNFTHKNVALWIMFTTDEFWLQILHNNTKLRKQKKKTTLPKGQFIVK
jgi:hypothetical protein